MTMLMTFGVLITSNIILVCESFGGEGRVTLDVKIDPCDDDGLVFERLLRMAQEIASNNLN